MIDSITKKINDSPTTEDQTKSLRSIGKSMNKIVSYTKEMKSLIVDNYGLSANELKKNTEENASSSDETTGLLEKIHNFLLDRRKETIRETTKTKKSRPSKTAKDSNSNDDENKLKSPRKAASKLKDLVASSDMFSPISELKFTMMQIKDQTMSIVDIGKDLVGDIKRVFSFGKKLTGIFGKKKTSTSEKVVDGAGTLLKPSKDTDLSPTAADLTQAALGSVTSRGGKDTVISEEKDREQEFFQESLLDRLKNLGGTKDTKTEKDGSGGAFPIIIGGIGTLIKLLGGLSGAILGGLSTLAMGLGLTKTATVLRTASTKVKPKGKPTPTPKGKPTPKSKSVFERIANRAGKLTRAGIDTTRNVVTGAAKKIGTAKRAAAPVWAAAKAVGARAKPLANSAGRLLTKAKPAAKLIGRAAAPAMGGASLAVGGYRGIKSAVAGDDFGKILANTTSGIALTGDVGDLDKRVDPNDNWTREGLKGVRDMGRGEGYFGKNVTAKGLLGINRDVSNLDNVKTSAKDMRKQHIINGLDLPKWVTPKMIPDKWASGKTKITQDMIDKQVSEWKSNRAGKKDNTPTVESDETLKSKPRPYNKPKTTPSKTSASINSLENKVPTPSNPVMNNNTINSNNVTTNNVGGKGNSDRKIEPRMLANAPIRNTDSTFQRFNDAKMITPYA